MAAVIISGIMLKKTKAFAGDPAPFLMELPYHWPTFQMYCSTLKGLSFIRKAGTIYCYHYICMVYKLLRRCRRYIPYAEEEELNLQYLPIGNAIAWIFKPLGWGTWQAAVASFTGLIAKENIVGTMGILYGAEMALYTRILRRRSPLFRVLILDLTYCAPALRYRRNKAEMNNAKWTWLR